MIMTIKEYFDNLLDSISLKFGDEECDFIQKKQNALREKMREVLPLEDDFLTGSYKRRTILKPKNKDDKIDVDVFVAFNNEEYGETALADLREMVVEALHSIKEQNPALGITFIDDQQRRSVGVQFGRNFQIDIVPAVQIEKDVLYKIFDRRTHDAIKSNPKLHGSMLTKANEKNNNLLVPLVRVLKAWKRVKCDYVKSFHIELMAVTIFQNTAIKSISEGLGIFFESAGDYFKEKCLKDPANDEVFVDEYLDRDGNRDKIHSLVKKEEGVARNARKKERGGDDDGAIAEWRKLFSDHDAEMAEAIRRGNVYSAIGGATVKPNTPNHDEERINAPRSWGG